MSPPETIRIAAEGPVLHITLARPEVRNAFDERTIAELDAAFRGPARDPALKALVLKGEGPAFCAGADLNWMRRAAGGSQAANLADARALSGMFQALTEVPVPTLALVHGAALGGGTGLAAAADVAIGTADAKLGFTEVRLGIIPSVISPFVLRKVPTGHARRYFTSGEIFGGQRAFELGLLSEVHADLAAVEEAGQALVKQWCSVGPVAAREAKALVDLVAGLSPAEAVERTAPLIARIRSSPEGEEGMAAFLEKRKAQWPRPEASS